MGKIFRAQGAGRWFPASPDDLLTMVDGLLASEKTFAARPAAIVSPHAGFAYSGRGAAAAHACLRGKPFDRVVVVGPSHYHSFRGVSVLCGYDDYQTPLGTLAIDTGVSERLRSRPGFTFEPNAHAPEHSVENQLPFLKRVLPEAALVACVVGEIGRQEFPGLGESLAGVLDGRTAVVVSSDFTHYGARFGYLPFGPARENLWNLDRGAVEHICACDFAGFSNYLAATGATLCGRHAIALILSALQGRPRGRLLKYYTSSDDSGDFSHTVCYASIVMEFA